MNVYRGVHELIGHTPIVEITRFSLPEGVRLFAKLEFYNPGGSVKDRLGRELIEDALEKGLVTQGGTIIEPTAGNTGIGLALAALEHDLRVIVCVPEKFSIEKQELMKALGAELWQALNGEINIFVAGAGTGGTFMGTASYLKEKNIDIKTVIVEPEGSILNGGKAGSHETEGIGLEFIPPFLKTSYFDEIHTISDRNAFLRVKELAQKEGLLVGSSSGAAFHASLLEAEKATPGTNIVTIFPDSSERYLSKDIYKGWE